ncbi:MAG: dTDP-4-dehydrorhamnose reductase [bacterium]|nr:dTDP-4-dehydrorhamnose reductase [bacterium]
MRVLITGAAGLLGKYLLDTSPLEVEILPVVRRKSNINNEIICDLTNDEAIEKISKLNPDVIIHTAAMTDVDKCETNPLEAYKNNVISTRNVCIAASRFASVVVFISSDYVFDGKKKIYNEFDKPNPINTYGKTKLISEDFVKHLCDRFFIIRTSWLFGKYKDNTFTVVIKKIKNKEHAYVADDIVSSPTYAKHLAQKIWQVIQTQKFGIYHITNSGFTSRYNLALYVVKKLNLDEKYLKKVKQKDLKLPAPRPSSSASQNLFLELNGFEKLPDWKDAVDESLVELGYKL